MIFINCNYKNYNLNVNAWKLTVTTNSLIYIDTILIREGKLQYSITSVLLSIDFLIFHI